MSFNLSQWPMFDRLKATFPGALRSELEQATLRVAIGGIVLVYLTWYSARNNSSGQPMSEVLGVAVTFFLFAVSVTARIISAVDVSVFRRLVGMVADNAATSYCLMRTGEGGAVILGVYLFVTFGNGFRYGRIYLHLSQVMGLVGFSLVLMFSPFWSIHIPIGIGFLVAMLVLPFYVGVLAERINEARNRADEANKAKGRFLANISHEMRTPLNGVIAMSDVLRETGLNESQREIVETLGTSAHLLLAQIEGVLDMAKIEAGRVQIENRPFDLGKLLSGTVKIVLPQARYKSLSVKTEISPDVARWFIGDGHHLGQVLLNLLANAVKFTETGGIVFRANMIQRDEHKARIRFEVKDTGIGIPQAQQAVIFEPFTQADESITRLYGGTGLGTTIARQLVTLMGGEIGLQSAVDVGSLFWFELPLSFGESIAVDFTAEFGSRATPFSAVAAVMAQRQPKVTKIRGARILVAEDNATNQRVTRMVLESGGHRVTIVDNGEQALDALERESFDLAIFDLSMPVISGLEALKLYQFTTSMPIPILILSANVTPNVIAECERAGAAAFIPKPMRASMLLGIIENQLSTIGDEIDLATSTPPRAEDRPSLTIVDTPAIDAGVLQDLSNLSNDPTFVERLIRSFRIDTEHLVKAVGEGLAARRYNEVRDAAHALRGGSGSVGAIQLVQMASRLENASQDTLRIKGAMLIEELTRTAERTLSVLDRHVEERRRSSL
jgi:two-component system, sensor histidine kinase RpfC